MRQLIQGRIRMADFNLHWEARRKQHVLDSTTRRQKEIVRSFFSTLPSNLTVSNMPKWSGPGYRMEPGKWQRDRVYQTLYPNTYGRYREDPREMALWAAGLQTPSMAPPDHLKPDVNLNHTIY